MDAVLDYEVLREVYNLWINREPLQGDIYWIYSKSMVMGIFLVIINF
jgi:hypothetical protein